MTKKLRWGLLSTARINRQLIEAIHLSDRSELAAVGSRSQDKADAYAKTWKIPRSYGSYEALFADTDIDVIYNSLPNQMHGEWSAKAMQAGKHVLCEKPFASSAADLDQMISTSRDTGMVLAEAFMYLHHPQTAMLLELIRSGKLGQLHTAQAGFHFMLSDLTDVRAIAALGGGSIWDVGTYPISLFHAIAGASPSHVSGWQHIGPTGVDMTFTGQLRFPNNFLAQFTSSFETPHQTYLILNGSKGRLEVTRPFSGMDRGQVRFYDAEARETTLSAKQENLYLGEVRDMEAAVLDGKAPLISLEQTASHVRTALALLESARSNQVVNCDWRW